uniref:Linker for activation of T cells family member 2 n=1 Tax=Suricata suricatta TaxID=37032 RepID=A0A673UDN0_SURSU
MGASGSPGSLSPRSVPPLSVPCPCLSLGLWEAVRWLSTAPCVSRETNPQNFAVAQTYSLVRQNWPGPLLDTASDVAPTRKDKLLRFSPSLEDSASSRYLEDFSKGGWDLGVGGCGGAPSPAPGPNSRPPPAGSRRGSNGGYILPITSDYYNWGQFQKPSEDDDDTNSYENVLICKPKDTESGDEESEDYQNSASIRQWRESRRGLEQGLRDRPLSLAESPDEEPDYVNESVAATKA